MVLQGLPLVAMQCSNQAALWTSGELVGWASKRSHGVKTWNNRYCVIKDSHLFYFRDELLHVLKGVIPLEGARLRKPRPLQRSVGSAELRFCIVLDLASSAAESCRHVQYEFCWNSAEEQSKWARALMLASIPRKALLKVAAQAGSLEALLLATRGRSSEKPLASLRSEASSNFLAELEGLDLLASPSTATTPRGCSITSSTSPGPCEATAKKRASLLATAVRSSKFGAALQPATAEAPTPAGPTSPPVQQPLEQREPPTPAGQVEVTETSRDPVMVSDEMQRQPSTLWELAQAGLFNSPSENQLIDAYSGQAAKSGSVIIHADPPTQAEPAQAPATRALTGDTGTGKPTSDRAEAEDSPPPVPHRPFKALKSILSSRNSPRSSAATPAAQPAAPAARSEAGTTPSPAALRIPNPPSSPQAPKAPAQAAKPWPASSSPLRPGAAAPKPDRPDAVVDLLTSFLAMAVQHEKQAVVAGTPGPATSPFDEELTMLLEATALPPTPRKLPAGPMQPAASPTSTRGGLGAMLPMHRRAASQQVTSVKPFVLAAPLRAESNLLTSLQAEIGRRHAPLTS